MAAIEESMNPAIHVENASYMLKESPRSNEYYFPVKLVPIKIDAIFDKSRYVETFLWNIHEIMFTPEEFAAALIADLDTPDSHEFAPVIRQQILDQIAQYSQMDCDSLQEPGEEINFEYSVVRVVVKFSLLIGVSKVKEYFEFPLFLNWGETPEGFADRLRKELGADKEAIGVIAQALKEQIILARINFTVDMRKQLAKYAATLEKRGMRQLQPNLPYINAGGYPKNEMDMEVDQDIEYVCQYKRKHVQFNDFSTATASFDNLSSNVNDEPSFSPPKKIQRTSTTQNPKIHLTLTEEAAKDPATYTIQEKKLIKSFINNKQVPTFMHTVSETQVSEEKAIKKIKIPYMKEKRPNKPKIANAAGTSKPLKPKKPKLAKSSSSSSPLSSNSCSTQKTKEGTKRPKAEKKVLTPQEEEILKAQVELMIETNQIIKECMDSRTSIDLVNVSNHRGFGASGKAFNADGNLEVGEFRKSWFCSWCCLSGKYTPTLRKGPLGPKTLCNACGIWASKHGLMPKERYRECFESGGDGKTNGIGETINVGSVTEGMMVE